MARWHRASQVIGFFDEGYIESQLFKSDWDTYSMTEVASHANRIIKELSF